MRVHVTCVLFSRVASELVWSPRCPGRQTRTLLYRLSQGIALPTQLCFLVCEPSSVSQCPQPPLPSQAFLLPPACHCFISWSLRKQGYLCPGFSFEADHSRQLLKSYVLMLPLSAIPDPLGVVLPAAALACTLKLGSCPKAFIETVLFSDPAPQFFFLPSLSAHLVLPPSLPASRLMCFSLFVTCHPWNGKSLPAPQPGTWFLCFERTLPPPQGGMGAVGASWAQPRPGHAPACCSPEQSSQSQAGAAC